MTDEKCFVFGDNQNALTTALLANGGGMNGAWSNPLWALIVLGFLGNNFGGNWGGNNSQLSQIQDTLNTNQGNTLLMNAITSNGAANVTAVKELASAVNCNYNAVQGAISAVKDVIGSVGNSLGMNTMQIVNAVNSGDTAIITAVKDCCCQTQQSVLKMGYENQINNLQQSQLIQNGFCQVGYEAAQNANSIKQSIADQTLAVTGKIDALESARKDREINALTAQVATLTSRAERQAELAPIYKALSDIQAKQPSTVSVPYPQLTAIPNYMLYGAGTFGLNGGIFG